MAWYDKKEKQQENIVIDKAKHLKAKIKYDKIIGKKARSFMEIVDGDLSENIQYRIVTTMSFNAISVLSYINDNYEIEEMYIVVYRMNQQSVLKIFDFINNSDIKSYIVLSSFFRENKRYEKWCEDLSNYASSHDNVRLGFAWNHAKVFLAKTKCGKHIVFEGSGNLSDNARIEQYIYENNEQSYKFHQNWITEILEDADK